jgi:hypothetical protein
MWVNVEAINLKGIVEERMRRTAGNVHILY